MTELKPCPFCGAEAKITPYLDRWGSRVYGYHVVCEDCGATTYVCKCEQPAVDDWNTGFLIKKI